MLFGCADPPPPEDVELVSDEPPGPFCDWVEELEVLDEVWDVCDDVFEDLRVILLINDHVH